MSARPQCSASSTTRRANFQNGVRAIRVTRNDLRDNGLLDVLRRDMWPLLSDRTPVSKDERERILGYDPDTGVCVHVRP